MDRFCKAISWTKSFFGGDGRDNAENQTRFRSYMSATYPQLYRAINAELHNTESTKKAQVAELIIQCPNHFANGDWSQLNSLIERLSSMLLPDQPEFDESKNEKRQLVPHGEKGPVVQPGRKTPVVDRDGSMLPFGSHGDLSMSAASNGPVSPVNAVWKAVDASSKDFRALTDSVGKAIKMFETDPLASNPDKADAAKQGISGHGEVGCGAAAQIVDSWCKRDAEIAGRNAETQQAGINAKTDAIKSAQNLLGTGYRQHQRTVRTAITETTKLQKHFISAQVEDRIDAREKYIEYRKIELQHAVNTNIPLQEVLGEKRLKMKKSKQQHQYRVLVLAHSFGYGGAVALMAAFALYNWLLPSMFASVVNAILLPVLIFGSIVFTLGKAPGLLSKFVGDFQQLEEKSDGEKKGKKNIPMLAHHKHLALTNSANEENREGPEIKEVSSEEDEQDEEEEDGED